MVCSAAEGKDSFIIAAADKQVVRWRMTSDEPLPVTINVMMCAIVHVICHSFKQYANEK